MSDLDTKLRFNVVNSEAERLGYRIGVDLVPDQRPPIYMAFAHARVEGQATFGRFLCSRSSSIEAAEDGLEILRDVIAQNKAWPGGP
jgi:hypothetical protein